MGKSAFLFPGQGAQYVGMCLDFYDNSLAVKKLFQTASEVVDFDVAKLCFEGPEEELNRTDFCQVAMFVSSLAIIKFLEESNRITKIPCIAAAGLSLGQATALTFAEAIDFEDGLRLVRNRGKYMQDACDQTIGGMISILGLEFEKVKKACDYASKTGIVVIANINCPGQIVISGEKNALDVARDKCKELGAKRAIPLQVAGAYHSPLMKGAQDKLQSFLKEINIRKPKIPVIANATAKPLIEPEDIKNALSTTTNPVFWEKSMRVMIDSGIDTFYEIGPGRVLTGLAKKIDSNLKLYPIEKIQDVDRLGGL